MTGQAFIFPSLGPCATTMIVSLGFLPTFSDGLLIMTSVVLMYGVHRLFIQSGARDRT